MGNKLIHIALMMLLVWPATAGTVSAVEKKGSWAETMKAEADLAPNAKAAILMDMDTGTVIYEKNPNEPLPPASMTKIMTMLLIMESLDKGEIKLEDKVRTSDYAASMGGSQIFLEPGEEMSVEDMLKGIAIASGNDASVAMAEHISGTEEAFVKKMNEKAAELGLKNTHFVNCNGLPANNHYTSAYDLAIMSRELLKYDLITKYTGIYQDYLRKDSDNPFWLVNTNRLVRFYDGVDGLKTGYTSEAKFCLTATAKRNNMRVIAVVMGEPDSKTRNQEVGKMLDYAFNHYQTHPLYGHGEVIAKLKVDKGSEPMVQVVTPHQISILAKKGEKIENYHKEIKISENISAPVEKGQVVGSIVISKDGQEVFRANLVVDRTIERASMWDLLQRTMRSMIMSYQ